MSSFSQIFYQFLFYLSAGTSLFLPLVSSQLTGAAHSKLIASIGSVLSLLAALGLGVSSWEFNIFSIAAICHAILLALIWSRHKDERSLEIYIYYLLTLCCPFIFVLQLPLERFNQFYIFTSLLILGLINYIMILGHYYLVVPKLTVRPLLLGLKIYWGLLAIKVLLIYPFQEFLNFWKSFMLLLLGQNDFLDGNSDVSELSLIFFQQISFYIANPILSYFAYRLCLLRSTQSATGVFYVMVFFALISEMLSLYFLMTKGIRF
jgi:hypothetical protein